MTTDCELRTDGAQLSQGVAHQAGIAITRIPLECLEWVTTEDQRSAQISKQLPCRNGNSDTFIWSLEV